MIAGVFGQLLLVCLQPYAGPSEGHWALNVAYIVGWAFAGGWAAFLFAGEKEYRTQGLLQRIPVRWPEMAVAKFASLFCGTILVMAALAITGVLIAHLAHSTFEQMKADFPDSRSNGITTLGMPFLIVSCVLGFSLVLEDVLLSIVFGAVLSVGGILLGSFWASVDEWPEWLMPTLCLCASAIDVYLASQWLRGFPSERWRAWRPQIIWRPPQLLTATFAAETMRSPIAWRRAVSSHFWREWQLARSFGPKILISGAVLFFLSTLQGGFWNHKPIFAPMAFLFGLAIPGVLGIASFRADHSGRAYRLLANHGVSPDGFWWTKQVVWLLTTIFTVVVLIGLNDLVFTRGLAQSHALNRIIDFTSNIVVRWDALCAILVYVLLLFSIAQLASLLIPRTIGAAFTAFCVLVGMLFAWETIDFYQIPLGWTIGLTPIIFFAASWLRIGDWLEMRNTGGSWGKVVAALAIPAGCLFVAIIIFRVLEIPLAATEAMSAAANTIPSSRNGAKEFERARSEILLPKSKPSFGGFPQDLLGNSHLAEIAVKGWGAAAHWEIQSVLENQQAVQTALAAARLPPSPYKFSPTSRERLRGLLLLSARKFEAEDKLDDAVRCYLATIQLQNDVTAGEGLDHWVGSQRWAANDLWWMSRWASHPKQTPAQIKRAIAEIERKVPVPPISPSIAQGWKNIRKRLSEKGVDRSARSRLGAFETQFVQHRSGNTDPLAGRFPWERAEFCGSWTPSVPTHLPARLRSKGGLRSMGQSSVPMT